MFSALVFLILGSGLLMVVATGSFSNNLRPYYENGKLNSPMVATFVPASESGSINSRHQFHLTPKPAVSLIDILSPQQYADYHYQYHNRHTLPQNAPMHRVQLPPNGYVRVQNPQEAAAAVANIPPPNEIFASIKPYNTRYPFTPPVIKYRIGVVADLDANSSQKSEKSGEIPRNWDSVLKEGSLSIQFNENNPGLSNVTIDWNKDRVYKIRSGLSYAGRGMELSTLNTFNGKVYSCDDKTGVVYELPIGNSLELEPIPWAILADGNFTGPEGFKCEWGTIKDQHLWIGGHGISIPNKDNNTTLKNHQKFVKRISPTGEVTHLDWRSNFDKMAQALDVKFPGYVSHESGGWSDTLQKWVFMPRRISKSKFSEEEDKKSGSNVVLVADENFEKVEVTRIGTVTPTHGFSSFKWVPGTGDKIVVALKTVEKVGGGGESYIMAFNIQDGAILLKETKFSDQKFEGIEFI